MSLMGCLAHFTKEEVLDGDEKPVSNEKYIKYLRENCCVQNTQRDWETE